MISRRCFGSTVFVSSLYELLPLFSSTAGSGYAAAGNAVRRLEQARDGSRIVQIGRGRLSIGERISGRHVSRRCMSFLKLLRRQPFLQTGKELGVGIYYRPIISSAPSAISASDFQG